MNEGNNGSRAGDDLALLHALLEKTDAAAKQQLWRAFIDQYERLIETCVRKVMRRYAVLFSREDLDDVVSEVWVALLQDDMRKLRQYDPLRGFRLSSFIGMIATNTTIDHLRARDARMTPLDDVHDGCAGHPSFTPRDLVEDQERAELARRAMVLLSVDEREFLVACFQSERSPDELAQRYGVSTKTVYTRKFKLREKLADIVETLTRRPLARALARS
jgi:RNA polymerase sigma-70 factor (ECF subfamily)